MATFSSIMTSLTGFCQNSREKLTEKLLKLFLDIWVVRAQAFNPSTQESKPAWWLELQYSQYYIVKLFIKIKQPKINKHTN